MRKLLMAVVFVVCASPVYAASPADKAPALLQTDCAAVTNPSVTSPFRAQFCLSTTDLDGAAVSGYTCRALLDGSQVWSGAPTRIGASSTAGLDIYETPTTAPMTGSKGSHQLQLACTPTGGVESDFAGPFAFTVTGGKGRTPSLVTIKK